MGTQEEAISMRDVLEELKKINEKMSKDAASNRALKRELLSDSKEVKTKMDQILQQVEDTKVNVYQNTNRIDKMESEKRKRNIIIFGLLENHEERKSESEEKVMDVLINTLKSDIKLQEIDFITRMGPSKKGTDKPRGVLVSLTTLRRKINLLGLKRNLKGTNIYITEHFTREVTQKRKPLLEEAKKLRSEGKFAQVRYDKLYVEDRKTNSNETGSSNLMQTQTENRANNTNTPGNGIKRKPSESPTTGDRTLTRNLKKKTQEKRVKDKSHKENEILPDTDSDEFDEKDMEHDGNESDISHEEENEENLVEKVENK